MSLDARTIGEELLGAELVAGKELTEVAGSLLDALERGGSIWLQQVRWLAEDYRQFLVGSITRPADPAPLIQLIEHRSEHIASGLHQVNELIERECQPLSKMQADFLGVVRQDWRQA